MVVQGTGSSKNERHEAMCVVNKNGLIESNTETSNVPMMVNRMIMDIVLTIGPMEFSANADRQIDKVEIVSNAKYATPKLNPYLHKISCSFKITNPSLFKTIKSPDPKIHLPTINDKNPSQIVKIKV
jgi:hypothetical protein